MELILLPNEDINKMSFAQLQEACKQRKLPLAGNKDGMKRILEKHMRDFLCNSEKVTQKRYAHLLCRLSGDVPVDPVLAEDECIYERKKMEAFFEETVVDGMVTSPCTGKPMGLTLTPVSSQTKELIMALVKSGVFVSPDVEQMIANKALEKKAHSGDRNAMFLVADNLRFGKNGFAKDDKSSFEWMQKAHNAGHPSTMACIGHRYLVGIGVEKNTSVGLTLMGEAAGQGSDWALYYIGRSYAMGVNGFIKDRAQAIGYIQKALNDASIKQMSPATVAEANELLAELVESDKN
ncbi:Sel1 domain protein repeat-containing protein [Seminavis robusta]|uniref:Sel1 domain protein repeat-containing protein n=1 Tax=Seminavis robusta TaxID=568900 RepID=A0A9N8DJE7_9STRA|nr:Sel1 domain protein repeat-containing protein [Seminavis robusta]|eukprot:Sro154_g070240.1 Sel1 domain protein repeat-containing protein (293) ;mRNA; r:97702-98580